MTQEIAVRNASPALTKTPCAVSLSRLAWSLGDTKMMTTVTRKMLVSLAPEATVKSTLGGLLAELRPATDQEMAQSLGRLSLHYWQPDMTPEQTKLRFRDFFDDLRGVTAADLDAACAAYRRNGANRFFPTPGQLLELCREGRKDAERARRGLQKLQGILDDQGTETADLPPAVITHDFGSIINDIQPCAPQTTEAA